MKFMLCFFVAILGVVAWTDARKHVIPNICNILILILGIASSMMWPWEILLRNRCIGFAIVSLPILLINHFYPGSFGNGDVKFLAVCGFFLGWKKLLNATVLGSVFTAIFCIYLLLSHKKGREDKIPFGPWLCLGMVLVLANSYFC